MRHPDQEWDADPNWDSTFLNTRREALIIFAVWVATLLWAVPFSYLYGYDTGAVIDTVWGIPSWVFWGIATPWVAASVFALWFSLRGMADDDLGSTPHDEDG